MKNIKRERVKPLYSPLGIVILFAICACFFWLLFRNNPESIPPTVEPVIISSDRIFDLTNIERQRAGLKSLTRNSKLDQAAMLRVNDIFSTGDLSHEATKSGLTYIKAIDQAKYYNITKGENLAKDFFKAEDIVASWMNSPKHKENILNKNYQEIGIASESRRVYGVYTNITVQLFGGYSPPNYSKDDIQSWETPLVILNRILPSWVRCRNSTYIYQNYKEKCERIITIIQTRIFRIQSIVTQMKTNKWLTTEQEKYAASDKSLFNEQESIASFLNSKRW